MEYFGGAVPRSISLKLGIAWECSTPGQGPNFLFWFWFLHPVDTGEFKVPAEDSVEKGDEHFRPSKTGKDLLSLWLFRKMQKVWDDASRIFAIFPSFLLILFMDCWKNVWNLKIKFWFSDKIQSMKKTTNNSPEFVTKLQHKSGLVKSDQDRSNQFGSSQIKSGQDKSSGGRLS